MATPRGDTIALDSVAESAVLGDLVEFDATPYAGDAYYEDWLATLDAIAALKPRSWCTGRGAALQTAEQVAAGLKGTVSSSASCMPGQGRCTGWQGSESGLSRDV